VEFGPCYDKGMRKKGINNSDRVLSALGDLSEAVGGGFEKMHKEFSEVGDRFEKVDKQLLEIRGQLDRIETMILRDHARRLEALERKVGMVQK